MTDQVSDYQCTIISNSFFTVTVPIIWSKVSGKNTVIAVDKMMLDQDYQGRGITQD